MRGTITTRHHTRTARGFTPWDGAAPRPGGGYPTGFTLIEMIVTTGVLAAFMLSTTMIWRSGMGAAFNTNAQMDLAFEARRVLNVLSDELREADTQTLTIAGDATTLTFQLPAQAWQDWNGDGLAQTTDLDGDGLPDIGELTDRDAAGQLLHGPRITYRVSGEELLREIDRPSQTTQTVLVPCGPYGMSQCEQTQTVTIPTTTQIVANHISQFTLSQPDPDDPRVIRVALTLQRRTLTGHTLTLPLVIQVLCRNGGA